MIGTEAAAAAFMAAPFEPDGWDNALKTLADLTRSSRMQLLAIGGPNSIPFNWTTNAPEGFAEDFVKIGGGSAAVNWRVAASRTPFEIIYEADYEAIRKPLRSDIYEDYVSQYEIPFGCQTVLLEERDLFIGMAALRSEADGCTSSDDRGIFAGAAKDALSAIRMQRAIANQGVELVKGALETMKAIAFVCDGRGKVGGITTAAERWLQQRPALRLTFDHLSASHPGLDRTLQEHLGRLIDGRQDRSPARFWLNNGPDPDLCEIFPLPRKEWSFAFEARAIVIIRRPSELDDAQSRMLGAILDLTEAEADVTIRLARGQSREAISLARNVSSQTVNAQLKSIFRKADVNREASLIALVNKLMR